jgi:hypothetical protein
MIRFLKIIKFLKTVKIFDNFRIFGSKTNEYHSLGFFKDNFVRINAHNYKNATNSIYDVMMMIIFFFHKSYNIILCFSLKSYQKKICMTDDLIMLAFNAKKKHH